MNLACRDGRRRWIEARTSVLIQLRRMPPLDARIKATQEFSRFAELDRERPKHERTIT